MSVQRPSVLPDDGRQPSVVAVHAHPDDETLATGLALARAVRLGGSAHVITCTLGEEGEVIPEELAHLEGSPDLAGYRHGELHAAITELGATHSYLGGGPAPLGADLSVESRPRWRDSGMAGTPSAEHPRAFVGCDLDEAARLLAADLSALAPEILLTYDRTGGYLHPDHIRTHQVTLAAWNLLEESGRPRLFVQLTPDSWVRQDRTELAALVPRSSGLHVPEVADDVFSGVVDDTVVSHEIVDDEAAAVRDRALRRHRTQVQVFDGYFALSNRVAARLTGREGYAYVG